jgi:uncharacterized peroxidase-related enzyme
MPQPDHLTRLKPADTPDIGEEMEAYFQKCRDKLGMVPNVLQAYALRPAKLAAFAKLYNEIMLADSGLSKLEREMIAVVVSSANRCYYCLVAHGQAVRALSGDPQLGEMMVMNYRVAKLSERERIMLDFVWKLTTRPQDIAEADREDLRAQGFSEEDIFDVCDTAAFFNYTNRVAHGIDMMPNPEYHAMDRA